MKKSKYILLIQMIVMYVIFLPFYLCIILARLPNISFEVIKFLLLAGIFSYILMIPVLIASLCIAILGLANEGDSPVNTTIVVKIALIPWYLSNILVCILLSAGFLNPWLFLAFPIVVAIEIGITYIFMASTSFQIASYTLKKLLNKKIKLDGKIIAGLILSFIFCLDIIGCLLLKSALKNA